MFEDIKTQVDIALMECTTQTHIVLFKKHSYLKALEKIRCDFQAYLQKDPACYQNARLLIQYTSFKAVLHYRLANQMIQDGLSLEVAFALSNRGKCLSGAEIHPCATLGERFVLDHGVGAVIGETAVVGADCYMLGGVILGANGIAHNQRQKRHPTVGNAVQIGTRAKILGDVHIGDHVFIGADCLITDNIPSHHRVVLRTTHQVTKANTMAPLLALASHQIKNEDSIF